MSCARKYESILLELRNKKISLLVKEILGSCSTASLQSWEKWFSMGLSRILCK